MHGDFKDPIIPMHFALRIYRNGTINYLMRFVICLFFFASYINSSKSYSNHCDFQSHCHCKKLHGMESILEIIVLHSAVFDTVSMLCHFVKWSWFDSMTSLKSNDFQNGNWNKWKETRNLKSILGEWMIIHSYAHTNKASECAQRFQFFAFFLDYCNTMFHFTVCFFSPFFSFCFTLQTTFNFIVPRTLEYISIWWSLMLICIRKQ